MNNFPIFQPHQMPQPTAAAAACEYICIWAEIQQCHLIVESGIYVDLIYNNRIFEP